MIIRVKHGIFFVLLACVAAFAAAQEQRLYRWTDDSGRVHITDTPPPPNAKNVQIRGGPKDDGKAETNEPYALQIARRDFPVTLYSTPGCDACGEARKLLNARGIPFKEVLVNDEKSVAELKAAVGSTSVPAMIVGATVQKGYEEATYQRLLDAAGYPKTGVLPPRSQAEPQPVQPESATVKPAPDPNEGLGPYAPGAARQRAQKPPAKQ